MTTGDLWITHYSVQRWTVTQVWDDYLRAVERLFSDRLVKLDDTDPVRRKADLKKGEGDFIAAFGEREASRWVRGKFEKTKIEIEVQHYKSGADSFGRPRENILTIYVPERLAFGPDVARLAALFDLTNEKLGAFYAYADLKSVICSKKPSTPSLDVSRELLGVFWLTYFGEQYCRFFGREKLGAFAQASQGPRNGVTLRLAESPGQVGSALRPTLECEIKADSFAGNGGSKERGQFALTLAQLAESVAV
jgi:hypothetical protein